MFLALEFSLDKESDYAVQFYWSRESLFFYETWEFRLFLIKYGTDMLLFQSKV